jgi:hypothetical protein
MSGMCKWRCAIDASEVPTIPNGVPYGMVSPYRWAGAIMGRRSDDFRGQFIDTQTNYKLRAVGDDSKPS